MSSENPERVGSAQYSVESSFQSVADLAEEVGDFCGSVVGEAVEQVIELRLCVAEALNNIVEHAYKGVEGKPIYAKIDVHSDRLEVVLIDEGMPLPGYTVPETEVDFDPTDLENLPEGGFGWMLIREQMDKVDYERRDGCNVLTLARHYGS